MGMDGVGRKFGAHCRFCTHFSRSWAIVKDARTSNELLRACLQRSDGSEKRGRRDAAGLLKAIEDGGQ